jgi:hypothetical protein
MSDVKALKKQLEERPPTDTKFMWTVLKEALTVIADLDEAQARLDIRLNDLAHFVKTSWSAKLQSRDEQAVTELEERIAGIRRELNS